MHAISRHARLSKGIRTTVLVDLHVAVLYADDCAVSAFASRGRDAKCAGRSRNVRSKKESASAAG